jgi:hypothetical protein
MREPLPSEFALLAACCRWPRIPSQLAVIKGAKSIDWLYFLQLVKYHRVAALVADGLKTAGVAPPADISQCLTTMADASVRQSLAVARETIQLQQLFDKAGIPALFLKGSTLAARAYGMLALKHSRDVDLLTLPSYVDASLLLMGRLGYALKPPCDRIDCTQLGHFVRFGRELPLNSIKNGLVIEIKWRPMNNQALLAGLSAASPSQEIAVSKAAMVRTFSDADLFSYLCAHGAVHRWSRLKWLADLHALVTQTAPGDVLGWYRRAEEIGSGTCAAQALLLCREVFAMPISPELEAVLENRLPKWLAAFTLKGISHPTTGDLATDCIFSGTPARFYRFLLGTSFRFQLEEFCLASVQPLDAIFFRLPKKMYWLYLLLRVPFFVARKILRLRFLPPWNRRSRACQIRDG